MRRSRRKCRRRKNNFKKGIACVMSFLMLWQGAAPRISFGDEATNASADYVMTEDSVVSAMKSALNKNKTENKDKFGFEGDYAYEYEELFGLDDDSELYKLNLKQDESATPSNLKKAKVSSYLKIDEEETTEDDEPEITGEEKVIFIVKNLSKDARTLTMDVLDQEFEIKLPGKDFVKNDGLGFTEEDEAKDAEVISTASDIIGTDVAAEEDVSSNDDETEASSKESDIASGSDIEDSNDTDANDASEEDVESFNDVEILDPVLLDGKAAVAFAIPAVELVRKAYGTTYSAETDSAEITADVPYGAFDEPVTLEAREFDSDEEASITEILHYNGCLFNGKKTFDIHFVNDDGEEVEPQEAVDVSITLKKGTFSADADMETLRVFHMSEEMAAEASTAAFYASEASEEYTEEDAELDDVDKSMGYASVSPVADNQIYDELDVKTTEEKKGEYTTKFTVESFSYFIISYNNNNAVYAYLYDEDGNLFPGDEMDAIDGVSGFNPADFNAEWEGGSGGAALENTWVSIKSLTAMFGSVTEGYNYVAAYSDAEKTEPFYWIYYNKKSSTSKSQWWVSSDAEKPASTPSASATVKQLTKNSSGNRSIYLVFSKVATSSALVDDVRNNGCFVANAPTNVSKYAVVTYKWYRSDDGENFTEVEKKKSAGKKYNIETDSTCSKLYPSRDDKDVNDVRQWYKAEVYVDGTLMTTYDPIQVQYYSCIMNGDFESPLVSDFTSQTYDFPNGTVGLYWKTTASDKQIELIKAGSGAQSAYNCKDAASGSQWAELNAEARGALYQDVLVHPGSTLYWQFSHRGRSGSENMYMVIAPRNKVSDDSSVSDLATLAQNIINDVDGYSADDGYFAVSIEDGNTSWGTYKGSYDVPEGEFLVTFFFVSGMGTTEGNMIDNVEFSSNTPDPEDGYVNINTTVSIEGMYSDDIANVSMKLYLVDSDGNIVTDKDGNAAEKVVSFAGAYGEDNVFSQDVTFTNIPSDCEYTLKKVLLYNGSETIPDYYEHKKETYTLEVNDSLENKGNASEVTFTAYEGDDIEAAFTDVFEATVVPITITKRESGNNPKGGEFAFTVSGTQRNGKPITDVLKDEYKSFNLKNGESTVIYVPYGSNVQISEQEYSEDKIVTYYTINEGETVKGRTASIDGIDSEKEIVFINKGMLYNVGILKVRPKTDNDSAGKDYYRLAGATLTLYDGADISDDKILQNHVSKESMDDDWVVSLPYGDYTIAEMTTPSGYKTADPIVFHISDTGEVTCDSTSAYVFDTLADGVDSTGKETLKWIAMIDTELKGSVLLSNTVNGGNEAYGDPVFIYVFTRKDEGSNETITFTMDSVKHYEDLDLPAGEYTVKQIPVSRYVPDTYEVTFTVKDGERTSISFNNTMTQYEKFSHVVSKVNEIKKSTDNTQSSDTTTISGGIEMPSGLKTV